MEVTNNFQKIHLSSVFNFILFDILFFTFMHLQILIPTLSDTFLVCHFNRYY